jgi:peptidoglycan/xylan/chitin deacetylase (PgdA/CDA1 family)
MNGNMRWKLWLLLSVFAVATNGCHLFSGHAGPPKYEKPDVQLQTSAEPNIQPYYDISIKSQDRRIPVIMYHDVVPERTARSQWFDCSAAEFEEQMQKIAAEGYTPISITDLYLHLTAGKEVPERSIVLTFDDNYQGFYENAWPILKKYSFPAAMFVHTGFVGNSTGDHPKMTYDTLRELVKDPLFTVGSHTITHPDDLSQLASFEQERELSESKAELEQQLGLTVDFLAYPNGKSNEATQELSRAAGYKMSFSIDNGLAEESPSIMCVSRYIHTRLEKALEDRERAVNGGALGIYRGTINPGPVQLQLEKVEGVRLAMIKGGAPETVMSDTREGVKDFVARTGAQAGINGTFFAMAAIASTDNRLVGPCKTRDQSVVYGDEEKSRWPKLRNRPVVMWGPTGFAIVPFQPETMRSDSAFRDFMPDVSDVFMGGVWLVHEGVPLSREAQNTYGSSDIQDARRRAAIGLDMDGNFVMVASKGSVSSAKLAEALAIAGLREAVLLDSGFSTSLVLEDKVLASGHSTASTPSRPVPHAIVVRGEVDPESSELARANELKVVSTRRRR